MNGTQCNVPMMIEEQTYVCALFRSAALCLWIWVKDVCFSGILSLILKLICVMINRSLANLLQINLAQMSKTQNASRAQTEQILCCESSDKCIIHFQLFLKLILLHNCTTVLIMWSLHNVTSCIELVLVLVRWRASLPVLLMARILIYEVTDKLPFSLWGSSYVRN